MRNNPRMLYCSVLTIGLLFAAQGVAAPAGPTRAKKSQGTSQSKDLSGDSAELAAIRQSSHEFEEAFNRENAKALAALWTEEGDYIDETGQVFAGRAAIEKEYAQFFKSHNGVKIKVVIDALRLLSGDAAIEDGRAMLQPPPEGAPAISKYTAVHVKVDGNWLMSTVRDVRIETPSAYRSVADLDWLIGTWTAEEHGAKMVSVNRWVANKSFVERSYTVTLHDQTTTSGIQLIGFNLQGGHVQSWDFASDGGHAVGVWTPREGGWQAEVHGMTGAGLSTHAVNLLTRLDDNTYAWQSVQRTTGDIALPDTDEIIIRRQPAAPK